MSVYLARSKVCGGLILCKATFLMVTHKSIFQGKSQLYIEGTLHLEKKKEMNHANKRNHKCKLAQTNHAKFTRTMLKLYILKGHAKLVHQHHMLQLHIHQDHAKPIQQDYAKLTHQPHAKLIHQDNAKLTGACYPCTPGPG